MTEMFGEAWSPMSVPDLAPDDDDDNERTKTLSGQTCALGNSDWPWSSSRLRLYKLMPTLETVQK